MPGIDFFEEMARMSRYFKKPLDDDQKSEYMNRLDNIPGEAMGDIVNRLIDEFKPTPGSFPTISQIRSKWYEWRRAHPEKCAQATQYEQPCDECGGTGLLWFKAPAREGYPFLPERVAICAYCTNWQNHFASQDGTMVATRQQLQTLGCIVLPVGGDRKQYNEAA